MLTPELHVKDPNLNSKSRILMKGSYENFKLFAGPTCLLVKEIVYLHLFPERG